MLFKTPDSKMRIVLHYLSVDVTERTRFENGIISEINQKTSLKRIEVCSKF